MQAIAAQVASLATRETPSEDRDKIDAPMAEVEQRLLLCYKSAMRISYGGMDPAPSTLGTVQRIAAWMTGGRRPGLMLTGEVGTGKTTMMRAMRDVLRSYGREAKMFIASDFRALFVDNEELTNDQILGGRWCRFLLLDDVGTEAREIRDFGNVIWPFPRIVEARYNKALPLIFTTNLSADAIAQEYGSRVWDRLRQMCDVVTYNDESFRQ